MIFSMKFINIILFSIISLASIGQTWEQMEHEYYNCKSENDCKKIVENMLSYSLINFGDTSFYYAKANYQIASYYQLYDNQKQNDYKILNYLEIASKYYEKKDEKNCGLYHQILKQLIHIYYNISDFEKTYATISILMNCEKIKRNECYAFSNNLSESQQFLIGKVFGETCLNIKGKEGQGEQALSVLLEQGIKFLNQDTLIVKSDINKEYVLQNVFAAINLLSSYYKEKSDINNIIKTLEFINKIDLKILDSKYTYQLLDIKSTFDILLNQQDKHSKTISQQISLLQSGEILPLDTKEFYFEMGAKYYILRDTIKATKYYELFENTKRLKQDRYSDDDEDANLFIFYFSTNKYDLSLKYLNKLYNKGAFNFNYYNYMAGLINEHLGNDSLAIEYLNKIIFNRENDKSNYLEALHLKNGLLWMHLSLTQKSIYEYASSVKLECEYKIKIIDNAILALSNSEREEFIKLNDYNFDKFIKEASILNPSMMNEIVYNNSLYFKNILLESNKKINQIVYSDSLLSKRYSLLISYKKQLASNYLNYENINNRNIQSHISKIDSLESILMRSFPNFKIASAPTFKYKSIQENLKQGQVAIDFLSYNSDKGQRYLALLAMPNSSYPTLIDLCSKNQLDSIFTIVNENYSSDNYIDRTFALNSHYYKLLWKPIEEQLTNVETIYYSPIDELNNFSFSSFIVNASSDTTYLMDKYNLISVFSTSEVVSKTSTQILNTTPSISLYGGIQYNLKSQKNNDLLVLDKSQLNKSLRTINNKSRGSFNTLKFTKTEIDNIDSILSRYNWKINKISGEYATENNIKKIDQLVSPTILHFATHGFAFPVADTNISSKSTVFEKSNNPMQRSGLLFYASNNTWQGKRDSVIKYTGEDGVLTAEEVSNLDLTNTKLVVLSACQSGLGATKGTEGVYGLKRAFRLAGVDNLIVSLWPVPDKETMELMNLFYTELPKTKDIDVAFKIAQKTMRFKYTSNPWAWGGFVLIK